MKRVVIEFRGGLWDGRVADSASSNPEDSQLAIVCYQMTKEGHVGSRLLHWPPSQIEHASKLKKAGILEPEKNKCPGNHSYTVTDRTEDDESVRIQMDYSVARNAEGS